MNALQKKEPEAIGNSFTQFLQTHRGGGALTEVSEKLAELVQAVSTTKKGGTLTLTIAMKPASRGMGAVVIRDRIKLAAPQEEALESFRFTTTDGRLLENDPRQTEMKLAVHSGGQADRSIPLPVAVNA